MQEKYFSVGIDIGGTNISFGIVNRKGDILFQDRIKTGIFTRFEDFVHKIKEIILPQLDKLGKDTFAGIGIGAPNANNFSGTIEHAVNLPWKGIVDVKKHFEEAFELDTYVTNDANAAAIGEKIFGTARNLNDFLVVSLGTGLGSGFVANGKLIYGHDGFAGELGHVTAIKNGRLCGCGRKGCLEKYVSANGIVATAEEILKEKKPQNKDSVLTKIWNETQSLSAIDITDAAKMDDRLALEIFDFTGKIFGAALAMAVAITSPQLIIILGGFARSAPYLVPPTKKAMEANLLPNSRNKINIVTSELRNRDVSVLGAAALTWQ